MKKYYAAIDTNVIVAALLSSLDDSAVVQIFRMIINSTIIPLYSNKIINDYKDVLMRKKFSFDEVFINYIISLIINNGIEIEPKPSGLKFADMKDLIFYEVVLEKKDDGARLITGNKKHFPADPIVVTAAEFLKIINEE